MFSSTSFSFSFSSFCLLFVYVLVLLSLPPFVSLFFLLSKFLSRISIFSLQSPLPTNQHRPLPQGHLRPHSLSPVLRRFESGGRVLCPSLFALSPRPVLPLLLSPPTSSTRSISYSARRVPFFELVARLFSKPVFFCFGCVSPSSSPPLPLAGPAQVRASSRLAVEAVGSQPPFPLSPPFSRRPPAQAAAASNPLVPVLH